MHQTHVMRIFQLLMLASLLLLTTCTDYQQDSLYRVTISKHNFLIKSLQDHNTNRIKYLTAIDSRTESQELARKVYLMDYLINSFCADFRNREKPIEGAELYTVKQDIINDFCRESCHKYEEIYMADSIKSIHDIDPLIAEGELRLLGYNITMDMLRSINSNERRTSAGPLFKIDSLHYFGVISGLNSTLGEPAYNLRAVRQGENIIPPEYYRILKSEYSDVVTFGVRIQLKNKNDIHAGLIEFEFESVYPDQYKMVNRRYQVTRFLMLEE